MREFRNHGIPGGLSLEGPFLLQHVSVNEPLFPNLKTLDLRRVDGLSTLFIPLFLSPTITLIDIRFKTSRIPGGLVASLIATFPARFPNLQHIRLSGLPKNPVITAGVSKSLLTANRNTLRTFNADSPLTEEAREAVCRLSELREFRVVIERGTPLPSLVLPNLSNLAVRYDHDDDCLAMFHGATFGKLESIEFTPGSEQIGDFLGTFERVALAASIQDTLSEFRLYGSCSWNPTFSSLLSFTQMRDLFVKFPCIGGCSSMVDDGIIINLARAMPKLEHLALGVPPCRRIPTGVTAKGLVALAHHCPNLFDLCIHIQVASLFTPPATIGMTPNAEPSVLRRDCALKHLDVGRIPMPEESVSRTALTLARIFPQVESIKAHDEGWLKVVNAIRHSRKIVDCSGK